MTDNASFNKNSDTTNPTSINKTTNMCKAMLVQKRASSH